MGRATWKAVGVSFLQRLDSQVGRSEAGMLVSSVLGRLLKVFRDGSERGRWERSGKEKQYDDPVEEGYKVLLD